MKKILSLALTALLLTGCSSILPKGQPPAALYTLNFPVIDTTQTAAKIPVNLQILMPQAAPGLETERIALRKDDNQIDYYKDARWSGSLSAIIQSATVQGFDGTHRLASVSNDLIPAKRDYSLTMDIHDFQTQYKNGKPVAFVTMSAKLIGDKDNAIIATNTYHEEETASADNLRDIIAAFDRANQRLLSHVITDSLAILGQQPQQPLHTKKK